MHDGKHSFTEIKEDIGEISADLVTERLYELITIGYDKKILFLSNP